MSSSYWRKREQDWKNKQQKSEQEISQEIEKIYLNTLDSVTKEIESFFSRYATKEGISMAEAKKKVKKIDIEEYKRKAEKYVKEKDFSDQANEEMRLYNLTMKVNRLELLKANIGAELVNGANDLQTYYGDKLDEETMKELERNASILGPSVLDNAKNAKIAVDSSFQNATWSERVWNNQTLLKNSLSNIISNALIQGKNPRDFISQIRKQFDVSRYQAERLLRTEIARAQVQAQAESYTAEDIEEYEYVACGKKDCCPVCKKLDGKIFKVKDMECGENAPPMHPNCHCATAPYLDRKEYDEWLDGYKDHGLTFEEWKKDNLQFKPKDKFYEKMFKELRDLGVEYKPVNYKQAETIDEIVKKIAGGDKTVGSCASAGLACMGRLIGLDVFDFRGGKSQKYFSSGDTLYYLSQTEDMKSIQAKGASSMTVGNRLVKKMESGKVYYLCVGRHASIVRKINDDNIQYLELQSGYKNYPNGWYRFDKNIKNTLKTRFGCSNSKNVFSEQLDFMIDLKESNFDTENFRHLLGYINTNEQEQKKGKDGQIR